MPWEKELEDGRETMEISVQSFCLVMRICFVRLYSMGCIYQAENEYQIKSIILSKKRKLSLTRTGTQRIRHHTPETLLMFQIHWDVSVLP